MTLREIIKTTLKMTGLVLVIVGLVRASSSLPIWASSLLDNRGDASAFLANWAAVVSPPILIGVFLWLFPTPVADRIVKAPLPVSGRDKWLRALEEIGIRLLGLYLLILSLSNFIVRSGNLLYIKNTVGTGYSSTTMFEFKMGFLMDTVQFLVALALILGAGGLVSLVHRLRYGGRHELARNERRES